MSLASHPLPAFVAALPAAFSPIRPIQRSVGPSAFVRSYVLRGSDGAKLSSFPETPNKAPEPTPGAVTGRADARPAPAPVVAHL